MAEYVCSECGKDAYYDGRCGDGPVLVCGCDKRGPVHYDGRMGDGPVHVSNARPVPKNGYDDRR